VQEEAVDQALRDFVAAGEAEGFEAGEVCRLG
jgi:hypothetical protein